MTSPGYRYHPAVIAQAIGTLATMFPGRFWAAIGGGEHINERVTGEPWPDKETRQQLLGECLHVLRDLLDGSTVTHTGRIQVDNARVWDRPTRRPALILPALTPETAGRFAADVDGLITINQPVDPEEFEARTAALGDELEHAVAESVQTSADPLWHAQCIHDYIELGFDEVYLHHVGQHQRGFIDAFAEKVLPQLR